MRASILHTGLAILACLSSIEGATEYHGKLIGSLKTFYHGVTGDVYAVDARTLHIRNFNYDGEGPAAYFYVGSSKAINTNGHRLLDERGQAQPLKRYIKKHITLTLPEGKTLANVKWFSVWCDEFSVSFADVKIPKGLDFPKPQKIAPLNGVHAVSSEPIVVVDAQTLLIPSFSYDGEAPDAKFWVGRGPTPSPQGIRVPDENGKEIPLRRYDRKTIVLTLPGDLTVFEIGHFGVWCEAFTVDFGHVQIPAQLNVPPSLKMLGVSPQKRSRSLQLSALQTPQQEQRVNPAHDKHFNYQNVLPLFNVQDTLRPTTYRPQLLVQPSTVDPQSLQGVDHRFSQKHTNGYLPLNNQRQFPPPAVQIIPSVSLNDDNGLISQNQFDLGPLNQQYYLDPNLYNQQIQYDQFRNGQPPFVINVQDEQFAYQRPIRKESDQPPTNTIQPKPATQQASQHKQQRQLQQSGVNKVQNVQAQPVPPQQLQPELFQIPILPQGAGVSISSAILAEEFQQTSVEQPQPIPRQAPVPQPADILTVPQFVNNGFFSTDFGPSGPRPPPSRPVQPARPTSRLRSFGSSASSRKIVPFTNNPEGSFSRFVLSSGSGLHETLVKY